MSHLQNPLGAWAALLAGAAFTSLAAEVEESKLPPPADRKIEFGRDIKPILENNCFKCHAGDKPKSDFRLNTREAALKGGRQGVDIIPGQSAKSPLIHYVARLVEDMEMPPEGRGTPLTREQVGLLRAWIDQGVVWGEEIKEPSIQATVSPVVGWTGVSGDQSKFRELYWQHGGWNGGVEDFTVQHQPDLDSKVTVSGHVLRDDYLLTLSAEKNNLGFTRFGWSQFRKYFDDTGGYFPEFSPSTFDLHRDLHLDIGRAWAEFGLVLPRWPRIVLGYEYQYRNGDEFTLQWGPVSDGIQTRNIFPALKEISEKTHILKLDLDYEVAGVQFTDNLRGEWYDLSTHRFNDSSFQTGESSLALTRADEKDNHFLGANTFHVEKQFTGWLFASGGYLYSKLNGDASIDVETLNAALLNPATAAPGWQAQHIELERESHLFSVSCLLGPWQGLNLSLGVQNEWTRQQGLGGANVDFALPFNPFLLVLGPELVQSDQDRSVFSQEIGLRFTAIPFTSVYAEARFQQERLGVFQQEVDGLTPFLLDQNTHSDLKEFRLGFNTSPWRRVSLSAQYRRYDQQTDYNNLLQEAFGQPFEGYPGFIRSRDLLSNEVDSKLALHLATWLKTTLGFKWLANDYHTATDPVTDPFTSLPGGISPGGKLLAGTYEARIASLGATITPTRRLFVSTTFAFQNARTVTAANDSPSVVPYQGNTYSVIASGSYVLDSKTDLTAGYSFSTANFSQQNFTAGLPLGIEYRQHALEAGIRRQVAKGKTLGFRYRFYHYDEPSSGGANNFNAHAVFATLTLRWP